MTEPVQTGENSWIVTLEEDPESGDLIMPLPHAVLAQEGWCIGDLMTWTVNENGTATLRKSDDQNQSES
jgi:hypothetical protein